ncbi:hypothetical protein PSTG_13910 [Puccinia striiformis f. sp. tritici PST-78]|uniref:HAT C-terminal dimerisation domain-containing protein n=1 Tax=Puccinia striiformis f. sp. tritici PST-78 TaxID=1165861 RepID=A0A0L0V091_9BASI|nr:hypothetical protein PSTG_13910 [Puccinia striiformis f. sp. tritici PST-78]
MSGGSYYNLKCHRDGTIIKKQICLACLGRPEAIKSGGNFPPTAAELHAAKAKENPTGAGTLIAYMTKGRFDNQTLNKLIVTWIIRQSLPWLRVEDLHLRVAFDFAIQTSAIHSRTWAASHARQLYLEQHTQVLRAINASKSKISLVSDVWTTKGSHKAFIGMSACYITQDWKYVCQHLAIKYISWHHNGKYLASPFANTTDSGSNNFTMAKGVASILRKVDLTYWDVQDNHHQCVCHVIALILGAGLKALKLLNKMIRPEREEQWFPTLETVNEEDEGEIEVVGDIQADIVEVLEDLGLSDQEVDPDDAEKGSAEPGWEWNAGDDDSVECDVTGMGFTLKKIDYICRRIASPPQKQAEWKLWATKQPHPIKGLIGGYGIQGNIALNSRQRAWEGRRVIKQLLDNKDNRCAQGQAVGGHFFKSYEISAKEWEEVRQLNVVLKYFLDLTKQFEGDGPYLTHVLYQYVRVLENLAKQKTAAALSSLTPMFDPMIKVTNKYLNLAINCHTVILATFLHPAWRMMLFNTRFKTHVTRITERVQETFKDREILINSLKPKTPAKATQSDPDGDAGSQSDSDGGQFNFYPQNLQAVVVNTKLEHYNNGDFPLDKDGCVLSWWKLHSKDFPILGSLARDYLACPASSATVERTFSAAAQVCVSGRSGMIARTIERCISSHMCLQNDVKMGGVFQDCQEVLDAAHKNPKFASYAPKKPTKQPKPKKEKN